MSSETSACNLLIKQERQSLTVLASRALEAITFRDCLSSSSFSSLLVEFTQFLSLCLLQMIV